MVDEKAPQLIDVWTRSLPCGRPNSIRRARRETGRQNPRRVRSADADSTGFSPWTPWRPQERNRDRARRRRRLDRARRNLTGDETEQLHRVLELSIV